MNRTISEWPLDSPGLSARSGLLSFRPPPDTVRKGGLGPSAADRPAILQTVLDAVELMRMLRGTE